MHVSVFCGSGPGRNSKIGRRFQSYAEDRALCPVGTVSVQERSWFSSSSIFNHSWSNKIRAIEAEIFNSRVDLAAQMSPFVSRDWLLRNIFHFSEEEVNDVEQQCFLDSLVQN